MKTFSTLDLIKKIVGEINPIGKTEVDEVRLKNLKELCTIVESLVGEIEYVASQENRHEYSIKESGKYAENFLRRNLRIEKD